MQTAVLLIVLVLVAVLCYYHFVLIIRNITTYEAVKQRQFAVHPHWNLTSGLSKVIKQKYLALRRPARLVDKWQWPFKT